MKKSKYAELYTLRSDGRYQGYWRDAAGKRHTMCDRDPEQLYKKLAARAAAPAEVPTFRSAADGWEREHREEIGVRTWNNYKPHLAELLDLYGDLAVTEISGNEIALDLARAKKRGYSRTVVQTRRSIWRMIFDYVCINRMRVDNPCASVHLPKGLAPGTRSAPTDEEIRTIMASIDEPFGLFPALLICTGLRKSEALALDWEDVDFAAGVIRVTKSLDYPTGSKPVVKSPKTDAGVRTVPILAAIRPALEAAHEAATGPHLFPAPPSNRGGDGGGYMSLRAYDGAWKRWQAATGITLTAHQLRHGMATLMFEAGVDELTASRILGHSRVEITREIYTELRQKQQDKSVNKLDRKLAKMMANQKKD